MNSDNVERLFTLFSGETYSQTLAPYLDIADTEVKRMLLPNADIDDTRLDFLCAAIGNYRYRQANAAQDRSEYTCAGKMLSSEDGRTLSFSENLLRDYLSLCRDLISGTDFVFMGV